MKRPRIIVSRVSLVAGLYIIAATAPRIAGFLLLPVYAYVLPSDELAAFGIAVALAGLIGILSDAGLMTGLMTTIWHVPIEARPSYLKSTILLSRLLSIAILVPLGLLLSIFWDPLFGTGLDESLGLWLILAFAFLQRGNTVAGSVYRYRRQHRLFAVTRMLPAAVQVVSGLLLVFVLDLGAMGAVAAAPLGFLISIIVVSLRRAENPAPFRMLTPAQVRQIVRVGAPVLPDQVARWAQMLSLRPLLSLFSTVQATAAFTFSAAIGQLVSPLAEAYEAYMVPRYYQSSAEDNATIITRLRDITSMFLAVGAVGTIVAIVAFDPLFMALAPPAYRATAGLAAIAIAGMMLRSPMSLMAHNLRAEGRQFALTGMVVIGSLVSLGQFFILVESFDAWSAAWAVYLYPATACAAAFVALRDERRRLVSGRDLLVTSIAVLGVLSTMVKLRAATNATQPLEHWWLLGLVGALSIALICWLVVRPRLPTTLAVMRGGLSAPSA